MAKYAVKTIVAVLPLKAGSERYFYRNSVVSDETISEDGIAHALSVGLITEIAEELPLDDPPVEPVTTSVVFASEPPADPPVAAKTTAAKRTSN